MPEEGFKKRLILADGTILENCDCGFSNKSLWCFLSGVSFGEAFQYFSSPEKFKTVILQLEFMDFIDQTTYTGLQELVAIVQSENTVDVHLDGYKVEADKKRISKDEEKVGE